MHNYIMLDHDDFSYTRLQAIIWITNDLSIPNTLEKKAGTFLSKLILEYRKDYPIIINCKNVVLIDDHALSELFSLLKKNTRSIVFTNISAVWERISPQIEKNKIPNVKYDFDNKILFIGKYDSDLTNNLSDEIMNIENKYINKVIRESYKKFDKMERLYSTPILASGVYDARSIISNPKNFLWCSLLMADELDKCFQNYKPIPGTLTTKLLAVSLRGSPFATSIGFLTNKYFDVIDHFGPKHKIFDFDVLENMQRGIRYIYVGDFIIAGTELKIAKTYAQSRGCFLDYAITLGCLLETNIYANDVKILTLVKLHELNKEIDYKLF